MTTELVEHADFPWCHVEGMSNPELTGAGKLFLVRATFPPGEQHNFHYHPEREEIIYVLDGCAEQWVGEERRLLQPGEMAFIPPDLPHATRNPGETPLTFLAILSPCETEGEFTVDVYDQEPWKSLLVPIDY
ncbi:MAG: cupin domain-containing protein [Verrucomicrobiota bacterium]